jgi:hypothetical protein
MDLETALGKALKFNAADVAANQNGRLGRNQRVRLLLRGSLLIIFIVILAALTAVGYVRIASLDVGASRLVFLIVLLELAIFGVVGTRGVKMLMDVLSPRATKHMGKLTFGDTLQPKCSANFIEDAYDPGDLSMPRLLVEGMNAYLIEWTREPDNIGIRLPCDVVGPAAKDRQATAYYSRWTRRPVSIEVGPLLGARTHRPR